MKSCEINVSWTRSNHHNFVVDLNYEWWMSENGVAWLSTFWSMMHLKLNYSGRDLRGLQQDAMPWVPTWFKVGVLAAYLFPITSATYTNKFVDLILSLAHLSISHFDAFCTQHSPPSPTQGSTCCCSRTN